MLQMQISSSAGLKEAKDDLMASWVATIKNLQNLFDIKTDQKWLNFTRLADNQKNSELDHIKNMENHLEWSRMMINALESHTECHSQGSLTQT